MIEVESMASPPRILLPNTVVFITSRTIRGLPFVPSMNLIIQSACARAQKLYPVKICALKFLGNHFHALIYVEEPTDIVNFIDRIKTETAHAVNILCNTRRQPVWEDSYDALPVLTKEDVIKKFVYLYTNAQAAKLVHTVDDYPGVSTWSMFLRDIEELKVPWIRRNLIGTDLSKITIHHTLKLTSFAWLKAFNSKDSSKALKKRIIDEVRAFEKGISGSNCIGKERLLKTLIDRDTFKPKKYASRMWCICSDKIVRSNFINYIKNLKAAAKEIYLMWKKGDYTRPYPLGLFPPSMPKIANILISSGEFA